MIKMTPIKLDNGTAIGISVNYPKTTLLSISTETGYIMCGILDIETVDTLHAERRIIAARLINVRNFEDMLNGTIESATRLALHLGIIPGETTGKQALEIMLKAPNSL